MIAIFFEIDCICHSECLYWHYYFGYVLRSLSQESGAVKSAKRPQLRRLQMIDYELRRNRFPTASGLAELLEVDLRTVHRDLTFMQQQWNAPIAFCRKRRGWHYNCTTFSLPSQQLTKDQLLALFVAQQSLQQSPSSPLNGSLRRAVETLASMLPELATIVRSEAFATHSFRQSAVPKESAAVFADLTHAMLDERSERLTYISASQATQSCRLVDPWHIACIDGSWYLFGWCHLRRDMRMFALSRIESIQLTEQNFDRPKDFSISEALVGAFGVFHNSAQPVREVILRCGVEISRFIREKQWHLSQKMEEHSDGSLTIRWHLTSLIEVARWIQSWGEAVEVLQPEELRDLVYCRAKAMARNNKPQKPRKPR